MYVLVDIYTDNFFVTGRFARWFARRFTGRFTGRFGWWLHSRFWRRFSCGFDCWRLGLLGLSFLFLEKTLVAVL